MKLLPDTHMIIWALTNDPRLPYEARELINSPDSIVFFSTVSLWEIAIKNQKNPEKCPYHEKDIMRYCLESGLGASLSVYFSPISGTGTRISSAASGACAGAAAVAGA